MKKIYMQAEMVVMELNAEHDVIVTSNELPFDPTEP